jgi:HSP20 family molecular chaperone IbpA
MNLIKWDPFRELEDVSSRLNRIFVRSFRVPDDADESAVKAEFKDGMLNVTLPKSAKAKPTSINVSVS